MCGIIGYIGNERVIPILLEGLKRLEYRGYDSAGIAFLDQNQIVRFRHAGKVRGLEEHVGSNPSMSAIGIGHTRWATHGPPTEENAHPHVDCTGRIALVHNGIIDNYGTLKEQLSAEGHRFRSQTDSEVLAHLIESHFNGDLLDAVRTAVSKAQGAFALAVACADAPDCIVVARRGSPLVIGQSETGAFACSDIPALLGRVSEVKFLHDDEVAELRRNALRIVDLSGREQTRPSQQVAADPVSIQKGGYKHFMLKEIHEQARSVGETVREKVDPQRRTIHLPGIAAIERTNVDKIYLVACGTAYHAALTAEYLWEPSLPLPIQAMIASEFRIRTPHITPRTLVVAVSQSGETIDTLMAVRHAKEHGARVIAVVNNERSAIDRESDAHVYTRAGIEIGVAASKTFTAQIAALGLLGIALAASLGVPPSLEELDSLATLPSLITETLRLEAAIRALAEQHSTATDALFLGRGILFPIALEGALKLKEISYIHAEGYPAGEMKHGPIALIDEKTPVVCLASHDVAYEKVLANMEEVRARNGILIAVTDRPEDPAVQRIADSVLGVPESKGIARPILFTIPLQLLAYHVAVSRGTDVDQPRNLAKTVTVE